MITHVNTYLGKHPKHIIHLVEHDCSREFAVRSLQQLSPKPVNSQVEPLPLLPVNIYCSLLLLIISKGSQFCVELLIRLI